MKRVPRLASDEAATSLLDQDLSRLDFDQFKLVLFELERKSSQLNMRLPESLRLAVKERARQKGIPYTRFVREALEQKLLQD